MGRAGRCVRHTFIVSVRTMADDQQRVAMSEVEEAVRLPHVDDEEQEHEEGEVAEEEEEVASTRKRARAGGEGRGDEGKKRRRKVKVAAKPFDSKEDMAKAIARLHRGREEVKRQRKVVTEMAKELDEVEDRVCATLIRHKMMNVKVNGMEFSLIAKLKESKA